MKILFASHLFPPSVGGIETVSLMLAEEFCAAGHQVTVITQTPSTDDPPWPFAIVRQPRAKELLELVRRCDVVFQNNISLRTVWPVTLYWRPWVVAHHIWIEAKGRLGPLKVYLKRALLRFSTRNIAVSNAIAGPLPVPASVIPNPYRTAVFRELPNLPRDQELVFVGRLVSDKGVDLLLKALVELRAEGLIPTLTIIGGGPEEARLRAQAAANGLSSQVRFAGVQTGNALAESLNRHRIMVVPSRWAEPFGIVALEGIACGCVVIGSEQGGLREAIGPCGKTFPNGDLTALKQVVRRLLLRPEELDRHRSAAAGHLARHSPPIVAKAYLAVLESALPAGNATPSAPAIRSVSHV